ncbi:hypothetical protein DXC39_29270 [Hungatella hathewayi]|uniref:Uncharacterized protein n=1 Tax=Hungatella hathewayi TaxID=154046 RepID=A0A3E4TSC7_9FIRM|nr:hypothetical protein [Enterocloster citroniae]RGL94438.1 hypothetical protein DXC39_29270 [Hungatella hathewayi]RHM69738.1 hypothetical protein DWZ48_29445 [Hungatella hathewayi]
MGRAMCLGNTMSLTDIIGIVQGLLQDDSSPWVQYKFK